jgi:hypothetical protein
LYSYSQKMLFIRSEICLIKFYISQPSHNSPPLGQSYSFHFSHRGITYREYSEHSNYSQEIHQRHVTLYSTPNKLVLEDSFSRVTVKFKLYYENKVTFIIQLISLLKMLYFIIIKY